MCLHFGCSASISCNATHVNIMSDAFCSLDVDKFFHERLILTYQSPALEARRMVTPNAKLGTACPLTAARYTPKIVAASFS